MGLVVCVDCDGKVSDEASTCPHCGKPAPVDAETIEALRKEAEKREAEELARRLHHARCWGVGLGWQGSRIPTKNPP